MRFDPDRHRRSSIRLAVHDYAGSGTYFVTLCLHGRQPLFGELHHGTMRRNGAGEKVASCWRDLTNRFTGIMLDTFVVMPDHFHGLIELTDGAGQAVPALSDVMQWFKTMTTNAHLRTGGGKLWQRGYFECIIRDAWHLHHVTRYIRQNPVRWIPTP